MSEGTIVVGDFEVDPDLIPDPPKVPLGTPLVFEVVKAERKESNKELEGGGTRRTVYINLQVKATDVEGTPSLFPTLFVTEKFKGPAHKSWKHFLEINRLPYTTRAESDLVGFRFKGIARKSKRDDEAPELASVAGPA